MVLLKKRKKKLFKWRLKNVSFYSWTNSEKNGLPLFFPLKKLLQASLSPPHENKRKEREREKGELRNSIFVTEFGSLNNFHY